MKKKFLALIFLLSWVNVALAGALNQVVVFGDSLSDNGNLYRAVFKKIPKSPPYYEGRFSNGLTWADYFVAHYPASLNYAVGGSTVVLRRPADGFVPYSLAKQVDKYLWSHIFSDKSKSTYVIWMGANDYLNNQPNIEKATSEVVNEMLANINKLIKAGGKQFFIVNLPDLSKTPFSNSVDYKENLHLITLSHNNKLSKAIDNLKKSNANAKIILIDFYSDFDDLVQNPEKYNQKFHKNITHMNDACWTGGYMPKTTTAEAHNLSVELQQALNEANHGKNILNMETDLVSQQLLTSPSLAIAYSNGKLFENGVTPCDKPEEYLFWDHIHPSAEAHQIIEAMIWEYVLKNK